METSAPEENLQTRFNLQQRFNWEWNLDLFTAVLFNIYKYNN